MAKAQTIGFEKFLIKVEDVVDSGVYRKPCALNSRGFKRTAGMSESQVPDCQDENAPAWVERDTETMSASISGAGVVDDADFDFWDSWFEDQLSRRVRVILGDRVWQGFAKPSDLELSGERKKRTTFTVTISSDGEFKRLAAAAAAGAGA